MFITYTCKYNVFNCFFCITCNILLSAFTLAIVIKLQISALLWIRCKCYENFILVFMQAHQICSFDTNCNFCDCHWLHQFSYIFFRFSHQPRIICQHETTKFVIPRTVVCLHSGCLCLSQFWMLPTFEWKQVMFLGWSDSPLLTESVEVHLALIHFWMNHNFHGQFYAGLEASKLTHMIHLAFGSCILELSTISQP